jgi:hypothetical protein
VPASPAYAAILTIPARQSKKLFFPENESQTAMKIVLL